jgi:cell wall-associated NlpC family hydrolase
LGEALAKYSTQFEGTPYTASSYNANTGPISEGGTGWGCATAMQWLYNKYYGINLPHASMSHYQMNGNPNVVSEDQSDWLPGDLLYFYYKNGVNTWADANHTGMYLGNGSMFHARSEALGTQITGIEPGLVGVRRVLPEAEGGVEWPLRAFANGGMSIGRGGPMDDRIPAMLSNGEYVVRASSVDKYGVDFMRQLNSGLINPSILNAAVNKTFSTPSLNDTMLSASDANIVSINNEFNITGDNPRAIADEVVKVLNTQQRKINSRTRI